MLETPQVETSARRQRIPIPGISPRERLLAQLRDEGVKDDRVIEALRRVPREQFVPGNLQHRAYENVALPIGDEQTISQPYVVAHMVQALDLRGDERVLEIGTGSGYGAAVLAELAAEVVTIEIRPDLAESAEDRLGRLRYGNVAVVVADGSLGWPPLAPFDAIVVTASAPEPPGPLLYQLRSDGGRLVAPIGTLKQQRLLLVRRTGGHFDRRDLGHVRFVPLLGEAGFRIPDPSRRN